MTQLWHGVVRNWQQLDRKWRIWWICTLLAALLLPLLIVTGGQRPGPVAIAPVTTDHQSVQPPTAETLATNDETADDETDEVFDVPNSPAGGYKGKPAQKGSKKRDKPVADPRIAAAYEFHQRFVLNSAFFRFGGVSGYWIQPVPGYSYGVMNIRFLPVNQTRIVCDGNDFGIRGRLTFDIRHHVDTKDLRKDQWIEYVCTLVHDPELDVWHLSGKVEEIASNIPGRVP